MPVEGNFIADFGLFVVNPGIWCMGKDFASEVGVYIFGQRDVFSVAQVCVWLRFALELCPFGTEA